MTEEKKYLIKVKVGADIKHLRVRGSTEKRAINFAQRLCAKKWNMGQTEFHTNKIDVQLLEEEVNG